MTQQFKAGDKVRVVESYGRLLTKGDVRTVASVDGALLYLAPYTEGLGWNYYRFELVESAQVEVGDTVEVTYDDAQVSGVVDHVYGSTGAFNIGGIHYVGTDSTGKVKITEKVKKPKVWAVGDVLNNGDYTSETILLGTVAADGNGPIVKVVDGWLKPETSAVFAPGVMYSDRTIAYIPEVSA